jgi:hypothetical protein
MCVLFSVSSPPLSTLALAVSPKSSSKRCHVMGDPRFMQQWPFTKENTVPFQPLFQSSALEVVGYQANLLIPDFNHTILLGPQLQVPITDACCGNHRHKYPHKYTHLIGVLLGGELLSFKQTPSEILPMGLHFNELYFLWLQKPLA